MTQYPPPPPYYGGGYYPPPGYFPPQPPAALPPGEKPEKPKSRAARIWDVLTILFEIGLLMALLVYLLGRISTNEDRVWLTRIENARALGAAARANQTVRLERGEPVPMWVIQYHGPGESGRWLPSKNFGTSVDFCITLDNALDLQNRLHAPDDEAGKKAMSACVDHLAAPLKGVRDMNKICDMLLKQLLSGTAPSETDAKGLLAYQAPAFDRVFDLAQSAAPSLADWEFGDASRDGPAARRRRALANLLILLHLKQRIIEPKDAGGLEKNAAVSLDLIKCPNAITVLTAYYCNAYAPAEAAGQAAGEPTCQDLLTLCLHMLNREAVACAEGRSTYSRSGELAAYLESHLPTPADITDRLAAWLIEDHVAVWQRGADTNLAAGQSFERWTGSSRLENGYQSLLQLSRNLRAIDAKPVTAEARIATFDGRVENVRVSDYLARLKATAAVEPTSRPAGISDGDLHFGALNLADAVYTFTRDLRIVQAELHLMQVNAQLINAYRNTSQAIPPGPVTAIDPMTGRVYEYRPAADTWTLYSDFGALDLEAKPGQRHDKDLDMQATLKQGVVLH